MSNILITGGAGYIGAHMAELLTKRKIYKIYILDNLSTGHKILINKKSKFFKGDINNKKLINNLINKFNIDTIIHLAASLNVSEAQKNKKNITKIILQERITCFCRAKIQLLKILFFPLLAQSMEI